MVYVCDVFNSTQLQEVAVLLSLMIACSAEDPQLVLVSWMSFKELKLESDVLLDNWRQVMKKVKVRKSFVSLLHLMFYA